MAAKPISPDFPRNTPAQKAAWNKYEGRMKDATKPAPAPYWKKEEAKRNPKEWSNTGWSKAELAAKAKAAALTSKAKKKSLIPASPTH